jgi:uncharacterized protein YceK
MFQTVEEFAGVQMKILMLLVTLLSGCASIDYKAGPVPGLEHMTIEEYFIEANQIHGMCMQCGARAYELPLACTCINFARNRAVIWLPRNASDSTVKHERAHAEGYDHQDGELRRRFQAWQARGGRRAIVSDRPDFPGKTVSLSDSASSMTAPDAGPSLR